MNEGLAEAGLEEATSVTGQSRLGFRGNPTCPRPVGFPGPSATPEPHPPPATAQDPPSAAAPAPARGPLTSSAWPSSRSKVTTHTHSSQAEKRAQGVPGARIPDDGAPRHRCGGWTSEIKLSVGPSFL